MEVETSMNGSDAWERVPLGWGKGPFHTLHMLMGSTGRSQMALLTFEHLKIIRHSANHTVHNWKLETLDGS